MRLGGGVVHTGLRRGGDPAKAAAPAAGSRRREAQQGLDLAGGGAWPAGGVRQGEKKGGAAWLPTERWKVELAAELRGLGCGLRRRREEEIRKAWVGRWFWWLDPEKGGGGCVNKEEKREIMVRVRVS